MAGAITITPAVTTNAAGLFSTTENGLVQGASFDNPATSFSLAGGIVDPASPNPLWGGVGVYVNIPLSTAGTTTASEALGGYVGAATNVTANASNTLEGFATFDKGFNGITTPQSTAPTYSVGMSINYYKLGSGIRMAVAMSPALVSLAGGIITPLVSWDYNGQQLVPYQAAYAANVITAASWASTSGGQVTFTTTTAHGVAVGSSFTISGMVPAGYNGDYVAITGTTGSTLVAVNTTNPGASTVQGTLVAGGGALNVKVLKYQLGGCKVVSYNAATGNATWNNNGNCAVIQL